MLLFICITGLIWFLETSSAIEHTTPITKDQKGYGTFRDFNKKFESRVSCIKDIKDSRKELSTVPAPGGCSDNLNADSFSVAITNLLNEVMKGCSSSSENCHPDISENSSSEPKNTGNLIPFIITRTEIWNVSFPCNGLNEDSGSGNNKISHESLEDVELTTTTTSPKVEESIKSRTEGDISDKIPDDENTPPPCELNTEVSSSSDSLGIAVEPLEESSGDNSGQPRNTIDSNDNTKASNLDAGTTNKNQYRAIDESNPVSSTTALPGTDNNDKPKNKMEDIESFINAFSNIKFEKTKYQEWTSKPRTETG